MVLHVDRLERFGGCRLAGFQGRIQERLVQLDRPVGDGIAAHDGIQNLGFYALRSRLLNGIFGVEHAACGETGDRQGGETRS
jgi:hypothetical protein